MCQWTTDSQRFILEHFDNICRSPSYISQFALPICLSSSWCHQDYSAVFSQEIRVVKDVPERWGACFRTVRFDDFPWALTYWKDTIAVGIQSGSIITLNAITGIQVAILCGHTEFVHGLVFSSDGKSLASGSGDRTIKLWDVQTGGVVKTLQGHADTVLSVSISVDCTTIASGSLDKTIRLWDIQTGECHYTVEQKSFVYYVCFFPLDPEHFMTISDNKIWQWDICSQQITPEYDGSCIAFSLDGTQLAVCNKATVEVQSSDSKGIVAKFSIRDEHINCCCFSPDNKVIAVGAGHTIYVWDITGSEPYLLKTLIGSHGNIISLTFSSSSSLISASGDYSVKFWQICTPSTEPVLANPKCTPLTLAPIKSITLQAENGIVISSHSDGMVRIWDVQTGLCKTSFQTPAKYSHWMDTCLAGGKVISVWYKSEEICIWDAEKGELLITVYPSRGDIRDLRISGDGSKVFCLTKDSIKAWSIWTGALMGEVELKCHLSSDPFLTIDGLRVWVCSHPVKNLVMGWDFGTLDSSPVELPEISQNWPHLYFFGGIREQRGYLPGIQDTVTKKLVLKLPERLARCSDAQWDGHYLVAGYDSGDMLILECNYVPY